MLLVLTYVGDAVCREIEAGQVSQTSQFIQFADVISGEVQSLQLSTLADAAQVTQS